MANPINNFYEELLKSAHETIEINFDNTKNNPWSHPIPLTLEVDDKTIEGYFVAEPIWLAMCEELDARKELSDAFLSGDYHRISRAVIWVERVTQEEYVTNEREDGS